MAKLPKNLQDIFDKKEDYLNSNRLKLEKSVISMQEKLLNDIISDIVSELDTENGQIKNTTKNVRLISQLEDTYAAFNKGIQLPVIQEFGKGLLGINKFNTDYFKELVIDSTTKKRFDSVIKNTNDFLSARIGVNAKNEISSGGFLDSFLTDRSLINDVKGLTLRAVSGQMNLGEYKTLLRYKVKGGLKDGEELTGGFERYYKQFAYDEFNRYDRTYSDMIGKEFGLNYAIYQGGLIDESRDFCREHNGHVYTREEVANFGKWTYAQAKNITTFEDSGNHVGIPSYIKNNPTYNPFIDAGSYNCRHGYTWVNRIVAYRLRPELKEMEAK